MKIEVMYPEICNLYGEMGNVRYLKESIGDCQIVETHINDKPLFLSEEVDLVYMGTMTESSQLLVLEKLSPIKDEIEKAIEAGQKFLITGNAVELFGKEIVDEDKELIENGVDTIHCLGIFDFKTKRKMMHRFNSLYVGKYAEMDIVGFKSQFSHSYYNAEGDIKPLFETAIGPGFNPDVRAEGIHYKNFMGTYLIGPLLVLNPYFLISLLEDMGHGEVRPVFFDEAVDAYKYRLAEYTKPGKGFYY